MRSLAPLLLLLGAVASAAPAQTPTQTPSPAQPPAKAPEPPAEQPAVPQVAAPGTLPHIEVRGTGPIPVILIPPFACDWSVYDSFMTRNADRYTMYAVTLPGFAKSAPPQAPPDDIPYSVAPWLQNAANAIARLIDDRALDKPLVLGVSTGGHLALRLGIAAPEKLRGIVTLNGLPVIPLNNTTMMPQVTRDRIVREQFATYWKSCPDADWARQQESWIRQSFPDESRAEGMLAIAAGTPKTTTGRYMIEYFASDLTDKLSSLKVPVLAISALPKPTDSQYQELKDAWRTTFAKLPEAKLAYFEGSGEFITEDSPAELDRAVQQFLDHKPVDGKAFPVDKKTFESRPSNVQPVPGAPAPIPAAPPPERPKSEPK